MNSEARFDRSTGALAAEQTLRMIATLPAPAGLEDRVKAGLRSAPKTATVIAWPFASAGGASAGRWMRSAAARGSAAAAIVLAIAGGGWGVYSHIQVAPVPSAFADPQMPGTAGRFSTAGAMHVPQTVQGPVIAPRVIEKKDQPPAKAVPLPQQHTLKQGKTHAQPQPSAAKPSLK